MSQIYCVSDIHLSHNAPPARAAEPDWYKAQTRVLDQVREIVKEQVLLIAGDVFHHWNMPPEIVTFAIQAFKGMGGATCCAIPGQHDLPWHNYSEIHKSAYYTLAAAGAIEDLEAKMNVVLGDVQIFPAPWGYPIQAQPARSACDCRISLAHCYIWTRGCHYPGVEAQKHISSCSGELTGYRFAVFGDNHIGFTEGAGTCTVVNCGCLIRRRSDEMKLKPAVYRLHLDGRVETIPLDVSEDRWTDEAHRDHEERQSMIEEVSQLMQTLKQLSNDPFNFVQVLREACETELISEGARRMVLDAIAEHGEVS